MNEESMKKFILVFGLLALSLVLFSNTTIDNPVVYGNWNAKGSPYIITTDIEIPQGETLIIDSGVTILVTPDIKITAYGVISVNGVEDNLVYFQGITETTIWQGIEVNSENGNFTYTNIIGAVKGLALYKTNYVDYGNIIGYNTSDFEEGLFVGDGNQSVINNLNIYGYMTGVTIKADNDADDGHEPTTPTMDVIRIYYSPESWKGERTVGTRGIYMDTEVEPTLTDVEIENYDQGITILADNDADDGHEPTTPTMDVIRIYYSPESWKGERLSETTGIYVEGKVNPAFSNVEIENYDEGITIKADNDADDGHEPTTPTMDVIRIYYSPESWKGERLWETTGIYVEGNISPSMTDVEIENYDEGITIKADNDADDGHEPTTPTMDVIRIYYSPESWKSERFWETTGIYIQGYTNLTCTNAELENYDTGLEFNCEGEHTLTNISLPNNVSSWNNYGVKAKGKNNLNIENINIQNYDNAIYFKTGSEIVDANILNATISNYNQDRANTKALYFKGAVNLFVDNSHITDYDKSIYLKNNYNTEIEAKVEHTEIYQTDNRRGTFKGIEFSGKVNAIINNNVVKSCDPAIEVSGSNSDSIINRNLIFITYHKNNSEGIDVNNINSNYMKHNTIVNYDRGLSTRFTPSELVNNIIWKINPDNDLIYTNNNNNIDARFNNISLPNGEVFPGINNINEYPDFVGDVNKDMEKTDFADKFVQFQLNPTSPCIDAGDPTEEADSDGTIPDLGVFEYVGNKELTPAVNCEISLSNYPNPFNPTTNILFNVAEEGNVEIKIYNLRGQVVKSLVNHKLAVGNHRIVWNGDNNHGSAVASGIYFVRMKQMNSYVTRKIILTK